MKTVKLFQLFAAAALCTAQTGAQDLNFDSLPSVPEIAARARQLSIPAPQPPSREPRARKEWTIMVFMNGKNNLSGYVEKDMNEMEKYGPTENINIIAQAAKIKYAAPSYPGGYDNYDQWGGGPVVPHPGWPNPYWNELPPMMMKDAARDATTDWTGTRRYAIVKDGDNASLSSTLLSDMGKVDMGDYKQLVEFGKWAKRNYPAKKYMLIVWNHGDGWKTKAFGEQPALKGISYDDETGNGITTVQLGAAVREIGGVDVYASDACLMQMAEVAYELKDAAKITVGSEENEPGDGWAYDYFLSRVHSNKTNLTPAVMAAAAVQGYKAFYSEKGKGATQSALKTSGMKGLRNVMDQWAALAGKEDKAMIKEALNAATSFGGADSRDLIHFMELVHARTKSGALKAKTIAAINYIYDKVLLDNGTAGAKYEKAYGVGAYLPSYGYDPVYGKLAWAREGRWDEFIQWVTAK